MPRRWPCSRSSARTTAPSPRWPGIRTKPILATASADLSIRLWNLDTGRRLEELRGPLTAPTRTRLQPQRPAPRLRGRWTTPPASGSRESLNDQPAAAKPADGWEDLLAPLTPAVVAQTGNGWRMEDGELFSPDTKFATLPLPGNFAGTSYQVRVKLRQLAAKDVFHVVLPVADRMCGFELDGVPNDGIYTGLQPGEWQVWQRPARSRGRANR